MDVFKILGIQPTTDQTVIKNAYYKAWGTVLGNEMATKRLNEAYELALAYAETDGDGLELNQQSEPKQASGQFKVEQDQSFQMINTGNAQEAARRIDKNPLQTTFEAEALKLEQQDIPEKKVDWQSEMVEEKARKKRRFWISLVSYATIFFLQWYGRNVWFAPTVLTPQEQEVIRIHQEFVIDDQRERADQRLADLLDLLEDDHFQLTNNQETLNDSQIDDLREQINAIINSDNQIDDPYDEVWAFLYQVEDLLWESDLWQSEPELFAELENQINQISTVLIALGSDVSTDQLATYHAQLEEIYHLITNPQ